MRGDGAEEDIWVSGKVDGLIGVLVFWWVDGVMRGWNDEEVGEGER